jgi:hypothetical protein
MSDENPRWEYLYMSTDGCDFTHWGMRGWEAVGISLSSGIGKVLFKRRVHLEQVRPPTPPPTSVPSAGVPRQDDGVRR